MNWFSKKKEEVPKLPDLPRLPSLEMRAPEVHQFSNFPESRMNDSFAQSSIKEAVTGQKEVMGDMSMPGRAEFGVASSARKSWTQEIADRPLGLELPRNEEEEIESSMEEKAGPVFVRIDRFEEALRFFERTKEKVEEMDMLLRDIKKIKEDEQRELETWEQEIQAIRDQMDRVNKKLFSKVE